MNPSPAAVARVFVVLSLLSFGGGNVAIPEIHRQSVTVHRWVTDRQFTDAFALSRSAPGPSTLFVMLLGARAAGAAGGAAAVAAMFLPGVVLMLVASAVVGRWENKRGMRRAIAGLRPVTIGMVLASATVVGRSAVTDPLTIVVAVATAAVLLLTRAPVLVVLAVVAAAGLLAG
jgi:chromate transporter